MSHGDLIIIRDALKETIKRQTEVKLFTNETRKIKAEPKHAETKNRKSRVKEQELELNEVKKLLKLPAGK